MICPFPGITYQTPGWVWLTEQNPPSPVPELVAFTVVPDSVWPQEINVELHTKSFAGAAGAAQVKQAIDDVPHEDAVPQALFVL